jgi:hypothetical protein
VTVTKANRGETEPTWKEQKQSPLQNKLSHIPIPRCGSTPFF